MININSIQLEGLSKIKSEILTSQDIISKTIYKNISKDNLSLILETKILFI